MHPGHLVLIESGTAHAGAIWQLANTTLPTLGTTALVYTRMYGKTGVGAGTYRSLTVDVQGRVTAGSNPTTLAGYGITDVYTKTEVGNLLSSKASSATTLGGYGITDAYTKTEMGNLLSSKASNATTLGGYGINDAYTKTEVGNLLSSKANSATTLEGYGILDAIKIGQLGLAANVAPPLSDFKAITPSGFYQAYGAQVGNPTPNAPPDSTTNLLGVLALSPRLDATYYLVFENGSTSGARRFWLGQYNTATAKLFWSGVMSTDSEATQQEAETGTALGVWMSPLRVFQAIAKR